MTRSGRENGIGQYLVSKIFTRLDSGLHYTIYTFHCEWKKNTFIRYFCSIGNWIRSCEMSTHVLIQHNTVTRLDSNSIFFYQGFFLPLPMWHKTFSYFILFFIFYLAADRSKICIFYSFYDFTPYSLYCCWLFIQSSLVKYTDVHCMYNLLVHEYETFMMFWPNDPNITKLRSRSRWQVNQKWFDIILLQW